MATQKQQQKQTQKHGKKAEFQDVKCLYTSVVSKMHLLLMSEAKRWSKILDWFLRTNVFLKDVKKEFVDFYLACCLLNFSRDHWLPPKGCSHLQSNKSTFTEVGMHPVNDCIFSPLTAICAHFTKFWQTWISRLFKECWLSSKSPCPSYFQLTGRWRWWMELQQLVGPWGWKPNMRMTE